MVTILVVLFLLSLMLPLIWAVPDMVEEAAPVREAAVVLVARHRRGMRRSWWEVDAASYRVATA